MSTQLARIKPTESLPPILAGQNTPSVKLKVQEFYGSLAELFEVWIGRRRSPHTQRAYRQDVMGLVQFLKIAWPSESVRLLTVTVQDLQSYRNWLREKNAAPKSLNRRVASISSFYKFIAAASAELR